MSKNPEITVSGEYRGVIYKYTHIETGKPYVGKTDNEEKRKKSWKRPKSNDYAGSKIAKAREDYGNSLTDWRYEVLEEILSVSHEELNKKLKERETHWIHKEDAVENGFNGSYGDGMKGMKHKPESKKLMSENHRTYQSEEAKKKISEALTGTHQSDETKEEISKGNKDKKRTEKQRKAQSDRMKGNTPDAATAGAKKWREANGGGYWKGKKIPPTALANMKKAQQARGIKLKVTWYDEKDNIVKTEEYPTMLDCAKGLGIQVGSVSHRLKAGTLGTKGNLKYKIERK